MEKLKYSTLVLGASLNPDRASNQAINLLRSGNYPTQAFGLRSGQVAGIPIETDLENIQPFHTLTLYLNPTRQKDFHDLIFNVWKPKRIIFNPGTESPQLQQKATEAGIQTEVACTLVLLSLGKYEN